MKQANIPDQTLFRYLTGHSSEEENRRFFEWLESDGENRRSFAEFKKIYIEVMAHFDQSVDTESAYQHFLKKIEERTSGTDNHRALGRKLRRWMRYAAVGILALSAGYTAYHLGHRSTQTPADQTFEIVVPRGGRSSVILPDGSSIWMNSGSFLRYSNRFDQETREVYLEGEALFEVEKGDLPFIVHTTHLDIFVHGTTFNVKSYPAENQVEATLIEGEIRVETRGTRETATIKPNQKIRYHKDLNISEIISTEKNKTVPPKDEVMLAKNLVIYNNVDVEETVSWQSGTLIINNETLESLVQKLERKWDVTFVFENEDLKSQSYSGTIPDFPIEQVLNAIALTSPVEYTIHEKTVHLRFNKKFEMEKH
jgi:ferric-dicitrate binding protein FerR (iron transport regulator)